MEEISILTAGDSAVTVEFADKISPDINRKVAAFAKALVRENIRGVLEYVPTFRSVTVFYDPLIVSYGRLCRESWKIWRLLLRKRNVSIRFLSVMRSLSPLICIQS